MITALAGAGSAAANPIMQVINNKQNEKLAGKFNQWSIDQWNRENAYNTPSAQMARLAAAGINPNMAFANGNLVNEAAASPSVSTSSNTAPQLDPLVAAQIANINAQTRQTEVATSVAEQKLPYEVQTLQATFDNLRASADKARAMVRNLDIDGQVKAAQKVSIEETWRMNRDKIDAEIAKFRKDMDEADVRMKLSNRELYERLMTWDYRLAGFDLENKRVQASIGLMEAQTTSEWFHALVYESAIRVNEANINLMNTEAALKDLEQLLIHGKEGIAIELGREHRGDEGNGKFRYSSLAAQGSLHLAGKFFDFLGGLVTHASSTGLKMLAK